MPSYSSQRILAIKEKYTFFAVLHRCAIFKNMVNKIGQVLQNINFKFVNRIKNGKHFQGISVNSLNSLGTSMIVARIQVDEIFPADLHDVEVCIVSNQLLLVIHSIPDSCCLEIMQEKGSNDLIMRAFMPGHPEREMNSRIPTLDCEEEDELKLNSMQHPLSVTVDLAMLRNLTKQSLNNLVMADNILFEVRKVILEDDEADHKQVYRVHFALDKTSSVSFSHKIWSTNEHQPSNEKNFTYLTSHSGSSVEDFERYETMPSEVLVHEKYNAKLLNNFLKTMVDGEVQVLLGKGMPIVIAYEPSENEYIHFVCAATDDNTSQS